MAPRKKASAPADRIYKSSTPHKQLKFSEPKKRITYGKRISKRIPTPDQETLTQMDFVKLNQLAEEEDSSEGYEEAAKKRKKKRRKTVGDQPSSGSNYHTQTLTQIDWSSTAPPEEDDNNVFEVPSSPRSRGLRRKNFPANPPDLVKPTTRSPSRRRSAPGNMGAPQTPHRREIPSSQSPVTPASLHSAASPRRQPLIEKSKNIPIPFSISPRAVRTRSSPSKLRIEDTFGSSAESEQSHAPETTPKRPSPAKTVRFNVPSDSAEELPASPTAEEEHTQALGPQRNPFTMNPKTEILDSDAESDMDEPIGTCVSGIKQVEDEEPETFYGDIGAETQMEAEKLLSSQNVDESQIVDDGPREGSFENETQVIESQRLATQHMNLMAPRTSDSDVFLSIHPSNVTKIVNRTKDHEFRKWRLPPQVARIWIYETAPTSTLKYMAVIGSPKRPGEILNENGDGNSDFNAKSTRSSDYAYEILELYELANPLPWAELHANEWLKSPPSRWNWARPAVLDRLMANLMPPLFVQSAPIEDAPSSSFADTQEADAQLLSTMLQFTLPEAHIEASSSETVAEESPAYTEPSLPTLRIETPQVPRPSQATTASLSDCQTPRDQSHEEVVWESPIRPVSSNMPSQLPSSHSMESLGSDSIVPYPLASSQLLTKSQMLPDSLLESVPGPPLFIEDSDEDDSQ